MKLSIESLAYDFVQREILPDARSVQYPRILRAMNEAANFVLEQELRKLGTALEQIKQQRQRGDAPQ